MKIYIITVTDRNTEQIIDEAIKTGFQLCVVGEFGEGPVDDIKEYVNIDSPSEPS